MGLGPPSPDLMATHIVRQGISLDAVCIRRLRANQIAKGGGDLSQLFKISCNSYLLVATAVQVQARTRLPSTARVASKVHLEPSLRA